jgi:hypothetical protein
VILEVDPTAVAVLTSRGHTVEPNDDHENWRVDDGAWLTAGDLLALAFCQGLNPGVERLQ